MPEAAIHSPRFEKRADSESSPSGTLARSTSFGAQCRQLIFQPRLELLLPSNLDYYAIPEEQLRRADFVAHPTEVCVLSSADSLFWPPLLSGIEAVVTASQDVIIRASCK